jgi:uncharacterized membrane protein
MWVIDSTAAAVRRTAAASLMSVIACLMAPDSQARARTAAGGCRNTGYSAVELPFFPEVISPSGVVVGITDAHRAVLWRQQSGTRALPVPDGFHYTEPAAITKSGEIVINASDVQSRRRSAFIYSKGSVFALAGNQTFAHGMSPTGIIVGELVPDGKTSSVAAYWSRKGPHSIELCCGGILKAANGAGDSVGDAYDAQGRYHAFLWSQSHGQQAVGPTDGYSSAVAINDAGYILIQVAKEVYLDKAGHLQRLELSPELSNTALAMNNCDFVVGGYGTDSDHYRAFLWTPAAGFQDLNSLIPANGDLTLNSATAINDRGEIIGRVDSDRGERGFLLVPRR